MTTTPTSTTARLKLETPIVPPANDRRSEQEAALIRTFAEFNYTVQRDGEPTRIGSYLEDPVYEITYAISAESQFDARLIDAVSRAFRGKLSEDPQCKVVFLHSNLFENDLKCTMKDIPLDRLFFGNIHENKFYNHWQVSFINKNAPSWRKRNTRNPRLYNLKVNFEFDRATPITVEYCVEETVERGPVHATYLMIVDGKALDRIVLDTRRSDGGSQIKRMFLVLKAPAMLKRCEQEKMQKMTARKRVLQLKWGIDEQMEPCEKVFTENTIMCLEFPEHSYSNDRHQQLFSIVSRLRARWNVAVEFANISDFQHEDNRTLCPETVHTSAYYPWIYGKSKFLMGDPSFKKLTRRLFHRVVPVKNQRNKGQDKMNERKFSYVYLIEALLSRGSVVKDQLLLKREQWEKFLASINAHFYDDEDHNLCESALEDLVRHVDSSSRVGDLLTMFERFCEARKRDGVSNQLTKEQWDEGYRKVRKVVLTPTRWIWILPETIMGNRAMTKFDHDGTRIIRSVFRDDIGGPMRGSKLNKLLKEAVLRHLHDGFVLNERGFGYLGSSSSQMKEGGGYFFQRCSREEEQVYKAINRQPPPPSFKPKIEKCRKELGDFAEAASVPIAMARFGQTLTQARVCQNMKIHPNDHRVVSDVRGGKNSNGDPYTFTDGIGSISWRLADQIARSFNFPDGFVPSAFQIRFRGMKGMLCVDPNMDWHASFHEKYFFEIDKLCEAKCEVADGPVNDEKETIIKEGKPESEVEEVKSTIKEVQIELTPGKEGVTPITESMEPSEEEEGKTFIKQEETVESVIALSEKGAEQVIEKAENIVKPAVVTQQVSHIENKGQPSDDKNQNGIKKNTVIKCDSDKRVCDIVFRKSQLKFSNRLGDSHPCPIELVKWSSPTTVTLNRPFINILDHVSASQSLACHRRICGRVQYLLDAQLTAYSKWIVDEKSCRAKLEDMPRRVHFASLRESCGFSLSTEPFFRSLIKAAVDVSMMKLLHKIQIQVPPTLGRTMFGVTDDSGQLQYGQVFFQYTYNIARKCPTRFTDTCIHKGQVLVTKFPSTVAGDVRLFEAVDIPALRHLKNVIVFPQSGPRPHPDEMAGSDLDGDEYAVIWDPLLFFDSNEKPFEYFSEKPPKKFKQEEMDAEMHKFFAEYLEQESVGTIASAHLNQSDLFGLDSEVCGLLARKGATALDYAKSGVPPPPLTNKWTQNPETNKNEPPERAERIPDFALGHNQFQYTPMYTSPRLLGTLFRGLRNVHDVVVSSANEQLDVVPDEWLISDGWQDFVPNAQIQMAAYNGRLRSLMENNGVRTEAEAFSGFIREINNRFLDRNHDDAMSVFNAEHILENSVTALFKQFREEFFAEFDDNPNAFMKFTQPQKKLWNDADQTDVLKRTCRNPNDRMMAKAVAYYRVCYGENAPNPGNTRLLSFAWIAYDILNYVKLERLTVSEKLPETPYPQYEAIATHRKQFFEKNGTSFDTMFKRRCSLGQTTSAEEKAMEVIGRYTQVYEGLDKILSIIDSWARAAGLLRDETELKEAMNEDETRELIREVGDSRLLWYHLSMLFIISTSLLPPELSRETPVLENLTLKPNTEKRVFKESELDRLTFSFFHYLSSRRFARLRCLNFSDYGISSVFYRGEWLTYHKKAIKTYYNILLNMKFEDELSGDTAIRDGIPFIIELPKGVDETKIYFHLKRKTRCIEVTGRLETRVFNEHDRLLISSRGTSEALQKLRDFAAITIPRYFQMDDTIARSLAYLSFYKITGHLWNEEKDAKKDAFTELPLTPGYVRYERRLKSSSSTASLPLPDAPRRVNTARPMSTDGVPFR